MQQPSRTIRAGLFSLLVLATSAAWADDPLAPEVARRLKAATVYVKVAIGPVTLLGSGFAIQSSGGSTLIVTNQHVVTKPKVLSPLGFVPGLRGRDRMTLMRIQQALAGHQPVVSVIFNSGEPGEETVKAEVLCQDEEVDLAVLKVATPKAAPGSIEFQQAIQPTETMPVFILGFPFGESLSATKANPSITIGRGSVSSIRKDKSGKTVKIQIDGALNPGNSGGPVVDSGGRLVGVAVQTIQGSNIGLAIPAGEVVETLAGGLGKPTIRAAALNGGTKYEIVVPVIDPLGKLKSASIQFVPRAVTADPARAGGPQLASEAASKRIDLPLKGPLARVELPIDAKAAPTAKQVTLQASYITADGKTVYLDPQVVTLPAPVQVTTTTDGKGGTTTTITQDGPNGQVTRKMTVTRGNGAGAPAKPGAFKVGDKVLVDWAGKSHEADVIGLNANGWVKVQFERDGITLHPTLPPDQLKPLAKKTAKPGAVARKWSTQGNKFQVQAKFVELRDGSVTLEKDTGETVTLPLNRLSEADQKVARELADETEENPFATKPERRP